jgi:hypothetical protein
LIQIILQNLKEVEVVEEEVEVEKKHSQIKEEVIREEIEK